MCLGTKKYSHWLRVEIDKPAPEKPEADENDERLDLSWGGSRREPSPERLLLAADQRAIVEGAVSKLGGRYAQVIRRRYYEDETQETVAQELGIHQSSVSRDESAALLSLKFVVGSLDRDGRNLGYFPRAKPPRHGGGVFPLGPARTTNRVITVPINFPVVLDQELDDDIRERARRLRLLMSDVPIGDLATASAKHEAAFHQRRPPGPPYKLVIVETPGPGEPGHGHWLIPQDLAGALWLSPDPQHPGDLGIKAIVAPANTLKPVGIERHGEGARGGEWPTAEWKLENREAWEKGGTGWTGRERAEKRGSSVPEHLVGLSEDSEDRESFPGDD